MTKALPNPKFTELKTKISLFGLLTVFIVLKDFKVRFRLCVDVPKKLCEYTYFIPQYLFFFCECKYN